MAARLEAELALAGAHQNVVRLHPGALADYERKLERLQAASIRTSGRVNPPMHRQFSILSSASRCGTKPAVLKTSKSKSRVASMPC